MLMQILRLQGNIKLSRGELSDVQLQRMTMMKEQMNTSNSDVVVRVYIVRVRIKWFRQKTF